MNKLVINSITIVDYQNEVANKFNFSSKSNFITSIDNGVGKSSLIKSIYYTLGAKIKSFPSGWNFKEYTFQLDCNVNERNIIIKRLDNVFITKSEDIIQSFYDEKSFSKWFQDILGMNMLLQTKKSGKFSLAYMNAVLVPFYIDQDNSWSSFYRDAIENVDMYNGQPKTIFEYYLGLSNEKMYSLEEKKKNITLKKNEALGQVKQITNVYDSYSSEKKTEGVDYQNFEKERAELEEYIRITNELSVKMSKILKKIAESRTRINIHESDLSEVKKLLSLTRKRFKDIEYRCTYCHSILTKEQSLARLELADNEFELKNRILKLNKNISEETKKLEKYKENFKLLKINFDERNDKINKLKMITNIEDYVSQNVLAELRNLISKYNFVANDKEMKLNQLKKEISIEKNNLKKRRELLNKNFEKFKREISDMMGEISLNDRKILNFSKVKETGTALNKSLLTLYLIYSNLVCDNSDILIPIAIDSFIKNEISDSNERRMFEAVRNYFISLDTQTFFSIIQKNMSYFDDSEINTILLTKPLLNNKKFQEIKSSLIINY